IVMLQLCYCLSYLMYLYFLFFFFFFQAEDGIRDRNVTGVQTCALPILVMLSFALVARSGAGQRLRGPPEVPCPTARSSTVRGWSVRGRCRPQRTASSRGRCGSGHRRSRSQIGRAPWRRTVQRPRI